MEKVAQKVDFQTTELTDFRKAMTFKTDYRCGVCTEGFELQTKERVIIVMLNSKVPGEQFDGIYDAQRERAENDEQSFG